MRAGELEAAFIRDQNVRAFNRHNGDGGKDVCRLTNFFIGDNLVRTSVKVDGKTYDVETGNHSSTYCLGFDKLFDENNLTCYKSIWDQILSYTFIGSALLRLARHAIESGD